jgi:predicted rRNA methylase YqxC with S4 and FtsJ domains
VVDFIAAKASWRVLATAQSPIQGSDGNIEYLLAASKS